MKILVIDDNDTIRQLLDTLLTDEGYEVITAADGQEGLDRARDHVPSLVITDILLPGPDGFQILRALRNDPRLRTIPVIFFTGTYLDDKDKDLARRLGVSRYLIKPMAPAELLAAVREVLARKDEARPETLPEELQEPVFLKAYNERLVNKLKNTMQENEEVRLFLEHIMEGIGDGIVVIDLSHRVLSANTAAADLLGLEKKDLIGRSCFELSHRRGDPCEGPDVVCPLSLIVERGEAVVNVIHTHYTVQGDERQVEITASPVRDANGKIFAIVETYRDLMGKKSDDELIKLVKRLNEAQSRLKHMAITDDLTGLRNRRYTVERLEEEFERAKRNETDLGIIVLDIDLFKQINDTYGHPFGDVVLVAISSRIRSILRKHDIVGRIGGEEFLVICPGSSLDETVVVAERIRRVISDEPIGDEVREVRVALSAGVTMLTEEDVSSERLFSRADSALYKAKAEGRNRVVTL